MKRAILLGLAFGIGVTAAYAQSDPIAERKSIMRTNGAAARTGTQLIRGEVPFDLAKAKEAFQGITAGMNRFPDLFPESTRTGDTKAAPAIWTDYQGFRAASAKIVQDANAAMAATTDLDSFKANFPKVAANCNSCHETYRTR